MLMKYFLLLCFAALAYGANPICQLKPEQGLCEAYIPSYYYDPDLGECSKFIYGGCGGNENRFRTREECERACDVKKINEDICSLERDKGNCFAYMPRYHYDVKTGQCKKFIYGGCGGNANNFKTLEECEATCVPRSPNVPVCEQKPETGLCFGYFRRYYYDKDAGKCSRFIYGGCGGNQNNFMTEEECLETCSARYEELPVCEQDAETGVCDAYFPRYYYNKHTGKCEVFIYGGCGGNKNNFKTKEECEENCQVD